MPSEDTKSVPPTLFSSGASSQHWEEEGSKRNSSESDSGLPWASLRLKVSEGCVEEYQSDLKSYLGKEERVVGR